MTPCACGDKCGLLATHTPEDGDGRMDDFCDDCTWFRHDIAAHPTSQVVTLNEVTADVIIKVNDNVTMSPKKMAAQAVHAALLLYGVEHGRVIVLGGRPNQIRDMTVQVHDAGWTELAPGTLTAGAVFGS